LKTVFPNYNESITNFSNSILKHFNLDTFHNTLPYIDKILDKNYKNVIVILCDGLGSVQLDKALDVDKFLQRNKIKNITSVFPPTTTAATTSMLSGLNPNEHGWLGWDLYFKKENKTVTMFLNTLKDTEVKASEYNIAQITYPYESIVSKIGKNYEAYALLPFKENLYKNFDNQINKIIELTENDNKKFIYSYYEQPDSSLHEYGNNSQIVSDEINYINDRIEYLCSNIKDSVVIVVADHGHIDCEYFNLDNYLSVKSLLERTTSIEPRAISFKIKDGKHKEFENEFNKYFSKFFILLNQEEVKNKKIFGTGKNNIHFDETIGDYVALAISNKCIIYDSNSVEFKSMHAGLTEEEMLIPIIVKEIK